MSGCNAIFFAKVKGSSYVPTAVICLSLIAPIEGRSEGVSPEKLPLSEVVVGSAASDQALVPVSGRILVGVALGAPTSRIAIPELHVFIPKTKHGDRFCLDLSTRDGTYLARNSFRFSREVAGAFVSVNYPTKFPKLLSGRRIADLAVRAEIKLDCSSPDDGVIVPASFSTRGWSKENPLTILVNAQDRVVVAQLIKKKAMLSETACTKIVGGANVTFTDLCAFESVKGTPDRLRIVSRGLLGGESSYELGLELP